MTSGKSVHSENLPAYVFLTIGLLGSFFPIEISAGFEFTLAPFVYLFALRIWGRNSALLLGFLTMLPSLWWWDHSYALVVSMAQILLADFLIKRWRISITLAVAIFYGSLGLILNALFYFLVLNIPLPMAIIIFSKKAINDLALAGCIDLLVIFWERSSRFPFLQKQKSISLREVTGAALTTSIFMVGFILYITQSRYYVSNLQQYPKEVEIAAHTWVLNNPQSSAPYQKISLTDSIEGHTDILMFKGAIAPWTAFVKQEMGCAAIASENIPQYGFSVWNNICLQSQIPAKDGYHSFVYSPRKPLLLTFRKIVEQLFLLLGLMLLALALRNYVILLISKSLESWDVTLSQFGSAARKPVLPVPLKEFIDPIQKFIYTNNSYVELKTKQQMIENSVRELQAALDLHFISDISWDGANNSLQFQQLDSVKGASAQLLRLHPVDQAEFSANLDRNETVIEFRTKDGESNSWYTLILKDHIAPGMWKNGLLIKLRASRLITENLAHQSRLVELGSMASAISHELKQPLFTIALAAENALYWLSQKQEGGEEKALSKIEKIISQVTRAKDIIERMTYYARAGSSRSEIVDIAEIVQAVTRFMRPIFVHNNIKIDMDLINAKDNHVFMSRLALEQILSNALQNAVDSIAERMLQEGTEGRIHISVDNGHAGRISLVISDNGIGIAPTGAEYAFDAFYTTKAPGQGTGLGLFISRQFVEEAGGKLYLTPNPSGSGANLQIDLPVADS